MGHAILWEGLTLNPLAPEKVREYWQTWTRFGEAHEKAGSRNRECFTLSDASQ